MAARGRIEGEAKGEAEGRPRRRKARRTRTAHPGVKLLEVARRSGSEATSWVARFRDPDTGRASQVSLDALGLSTAEARRAWAIDKAQALAERRAALASGAPLKTETTFAVATDRYFAAAGARLRPVTRKGYERAVALLVEWAERRGLRYVEQLTPPLLATFHEEMSARSKLAPVRNGRRGEWAASGKRLSSTSINNRLRPIKTVLAHWRKLGLTPHLDSDAIKDNLSALRGERPVVSFLRPTELRALLRAALRHDGETFGITREERGGALEYARRRAATEARAAGLTVVLPVGGTRRYDPAAPFVLFVLLSGMRLSEATGLRWSAVNLDARDEHGAPAGEITLTPEDTKTKHGRIVDLAPCPTLRRLLAVMKLRAGDAEQVFPGWNADTAGNAAARLVGRGAPEALTWQALRRTCGTFLTNAPGIFGAASAYRSARQLGHSVQVAERHYLGLVRGIPRDVTTLEHAMGIADLAELVIRSAGGELVEAPAEEAAHA